MLDKARITDKRVSDPSYPLRVAAKRKRRAALAPDGKLNIIAADHPARGIIKVGTDGLAMADRGGYLERIERVLEAPGVDGVMATMDIIEELLIADGLRAEAGQAPLLDDKLVIASLNRGGIAGSVWELDDAVTGPTAATCAQFNLDGAKMMVRILADDPASLKTLLASAEAIRECNRHEVAMFLEPLPVTRVGTSLVVTKNPMALARVAGIASALGDSSRNLWLKLPYCDSFEAVARATTLPVLLLGGESAENPEPFLTQLSKGMAAGSNVRGALVGRNVLYGGESGAHAVAAAVGGVIHQGWSVSEALRFLAEGK